MPPEHGAPYADPAIDPSFENADREATASESFLEFRLDYLNSPEQGVDVIKAILKRHPGCAILATCRRHQNHGRYNGGIEDQIRILESGAEAGAQAVDVEIETAELAADRLQTLRQNTKLIVSYGELVPQSVPVFVAKDAGIYQQNGLDVDLRLIVSSAEIPALIAGE